jgi:hypothetical protein
VWVPRERRPHPQLVPLMRRVLLIVGAAGTMLSEVRRDEEG